MVNTNREYGIDLLRCLALLFVVVFHSFLNNGYYYQPQTGFYMWIAGSFRWLSVSCIGIFLMITGYLKAEKDISSCYKGLIPVLIGYLLAAIITIPIRHFFLDDVQSFSTWLKRLFQFNAIYYGWYVEMYVGLTLLCPFINIIIKHISDTKSLMIFISGLLILTAIPGVTYWTILPDYWRNCYPITYYVLGATVKRLKPKINTYAGVAIALLVACILGGITVLSTNNKLSNAQTWEFPDFWIVIIVYFLFISLYNIRIPKQYTKILTILSNSCYGGYLLSHLLDAWCYKLFPQWCTPKNYILLFLCVTIPIYVTSLISGSILNQAVNLILPTKEKVIPGKKL